MSVTVNQQYGYQCTDGAIGLLLFQINNLTVEGCCKSGKAAKPGGNIAALIR
jgi:hypothetical protein